MVMKLEYKEFHAYDDQYWFDNWDLPQVAADTFNKVINVYLGGGQVASHFWFGSGETKIGRDHQHVSLLQPLLLGAC